MSNDIDRDTLESLLWKLKKCPKFEYIYTLEEDFNKVGLTIQKTVGNNLILCRIDEGKACIHNVVDDYIFIGSLKESKNEISDRMSDFMADFMLNNYGPPSKVIDEDGRPYRGSNVSAGKIIIANEEVTKISQNVIEG